MSKFIFIKEQDKDNHFDTTTVRIESDTVSLPELLNDFEDFLRGAGFRFDGSLEIVDDEITDSEVTNELFLK
jgi:hypothetical protein